MSTAPRLRYALGSSGSREMASRVPRAICQQLAVLFGRRHGCTKDLDRTCTRYKRIRTGISASEASAFSVASLLPVLSQLSPPALVERAAAVSLEQICISQDVATQIGCRQRLRCNNCRMSGRGRVTRRGRRPRLCQPAQKQLRDHVQRVTRRVEARAILISRAIVRVVAYLPSDDVTIKPAPPGHREDFPPGHLVEAMNYQGGAVLLPRCRLAARGCRSEDLNCALRCEDGLEVLDECVHRFHVLVVLGLTELDPPRANAHDQAIGCALRIFLGKLLQRGQLRHVTEL
eukprot:scaffold46557_cov70-Phaeocystis_antarctica.AAC.7